MTALESLLAEFPVHKCYGPDSYYIPNFFSNEEANKIFQDLRWHGPWLARESVFMLYRGRPLHRQKFFCVAGTPANHDGSHESLPDSVPKYGYPGQTYESMIHYKTIDTVPGLSAVVSRFSDLVQVNHVIGTRYEKGSDTIGYHQDKMDDIQPNTFIPILSFGAQRDLTLRKVKEKEPWARLTMEAGSLFLLGPKTNEEHEHSIPPLADHSAPDEKCGERISLVLRHIATMVTLSEIKKRAALAPVERVKRQVQKEEKKKRKAAELLIEHDKAERHAKRQWRELLLGVDQQQIEPPP